MKRFALTIAAGFLSASLSAGSCYARNTEPMVAMGAGTQACHVVISQEKFGGKVISGDFFSWAQGLLSGMNGARSMAGQNVKNLNAMPTELEQSLLDEYCAKNPNKDYTDGVFALFDILPEIPNSASH